MRKIRISYRFAWLPFFGLLCSCVGYPRVFLAKRSGTAAVEEGKPLTIKAAIVRSCESVEGESEQVKKETQAQTDSQGRYSLRLFGLAWNWKNLLTFASCASRVQLYVCREICKPADEVDINILGK